MSKPDAECAGCKFAVRYVDGFGDTVCWRCYRGPPTACCWGDPATPGIYEEKSVHPQVAPGDWCWKYEPAEAKEA